MRGKGAGIADLVCGSLAPDLKTKEERQNINHTNHRPMITIFSYQKKNILE